jgi:hypothetical protein
MAKLSQRRAQFVHWFAGVRTKDAICSPTLHQLKAQIIFVL